jgi:hypothetical protein
MTRRLVATVCTFGLVTFSSLSLRADVRSEQKTRFELAGAMGRMANMFAGKAAKEGVTTTVAVKGNRGARMNENTGQIVDLSEEKVYELDLQKKTYKVTTFAELRRRMEEAQQKMQENARKAEAKQAEAPKDQKEPQLEVDFDLKTTGEKKTINGFATSQQVMTITVREKGKTLEQGGGMVLTSDMWIAPKIAAMKEVDEFYAKFAQKLYGGSMLAGMQADQMAMVTAMYPMMKQAIGKMTTEGQRLQGTPILTTMTFDAVPSAEQAAAQANKPAASENAKPTGVGGLLGGIAKRAAAKKAAGGGDTGGAKDRATILTGSTEVLKVVTDVNPADVAVPAGFKEVK